MREADVLISRRVRNNFMDINPTADIREVWVLLFELLNQPERETCHRRTVRSFKHQQVEEKKRVKVKKRNFHLHQDPEVKAC